MALNQEDLGAYCIDQEGQCVHVGVDEVASHGDNGGVVSAFVLVVEGPCTRRDDNMLEEGWVMVVQAHMVVERWAWMMGWACEWYWYEPKRPGTMFVAGDASKAARSKLVGGKYNTATIVWQWRRCAFSKGVCWYYWLEGGGAFACCSVEPPPLAGRGYFFPGPVAPVESSMLGLLLPRDDYSRNAVG